MVNMNDPIFVRGMSRSGGTLMVTILDAHPEIAMSYELYPHLLAVDSDANMKNIAKIMSNSTARFQRNDPNKKALQTYAIRCHRGGLSLGEVGGLVEDVMVEGLHFSTLEGRMRMTEKCALLKMRKEGKKRWGMKCLSHYADYNQFWPSAYFLNMLRDGRDVLTSQLNTGNFKKSAIDVAKGWVSTHRIFEQSLKRGDISGTFVKYEDLTLTPEAELRRICEEIDISFDHRLLDHSKENLTVFSARHLSGSRISKKIDTKSVGRWRSELPKKEVDAFCSVAEKSLIKYGYYNPDEKCLQTPKK